MIAYRIFEDAVVLSAVCASAVSLVLRWSYARDLLRRRKNVAGETACGSCGLHGTTCKPVR